MLSESRVRLGKVYSRHTEDSHFSTLELFAAVPIYITFALKVLLSAAVVDFWALCVPLYTKLAGIDV